MRISLFAAVAAISLGIGAAHAAEGNGDPFGLGIVEAPNSLPSRSGTGGVWPSALPREAPAVG